MRIFAPSLLGLAILLVMPRAALAQEGIESDEEGTFSAVAKGRPIADTLHASGMSLVWTQHRGAARTVCNGDLNDIGQEVGWSAGFLSWRCTGAKQDSAFVDYDLATDVWKLGSNVFLRVGKKLWADDLLPRAVQPPKAYGDSVVLAVRQLYERVNKVPCADSSPEGDVRTFKVCSTGHTVWRILRSWGAEAAWVRVEFTFDSTGSLRFVYESSSSGTPRFPDKPYRRYYFANGRLVRITISDGTHGDTIWSASVRSWEDAEKRLIGESADAMVDARN